MGLSLSLAKDDTDEPVRYHSICALGTIVVRFREISVFFGTTQKEILAKISTLENRVKAALSELSDVLSGKIPKPVVANPQPESSPQPMPNMGLPDSYQNMLNNPNVQSAVNSLASNPQAMQAMQDPEVLQMIQQIMADPSKMQQFASHPKFQLLVNLMKQSGM